LGAVGFSREEVVDLAAAVCGDSAADLANAFRSSDIPPDGTIDVYSAKTVISVLSRLLDGDPLDEIFLDESLVPTTLSPSTSTDSQLWAHQSDSPVNSGGSDDEFEPRIAIPESLELFVETQSGE
ncbi:hypothetical protein EXIGLDRAFT_725022, partial [Exidia glandulosa HHB12029]